MVALLAFLHRAPRPGQRLASQALGLECREGHQPCGEPRAQGSVQVRAGQDALQRRARPGKVAVHPQTQLEVILQETQKADLRRAARRIRQEGFAEDEGGGELPGGDGEAYALPGC